MRAIFTAALLIALAAMSPAQSATAPTTAPTTTVTTGPGSKAVVVVFEGDVDDFHKVTLEKRFEQARELGAQTVIVQVNTYGGLVTAGLDISRFLKSQEDLHVVAFVDEKAISAGAMISLACNEIVMQPNSLIGDCAPIAMGPSGDGVQTLGATERAKAESPILEDFYNSAMRNGYDPLLVQAMVSVGRVVHWVENSEGVRQFVDGETFERLREEGWKAVEGVRDPIDSADTLLTLSAELAKKVGLASTIVRTPEELATERGWTIIDTLSPSTSESIVAFLSSMSVRAILTTIFLFALYMSFSHPGQGAPEAAAVSALALLVGVPLLTGYAQWWEILIILLGIILIAVEIFVIPGFGVTGITGIVFVMMGLTLTWVGDEPIEIPGLLPRLPGTWAALQSALMVVVGGMICSLLLWVWLQKYLPSLPYLNRLILTTTSGDTISASETPQQAVGWPSVGAKGTVVTDLRPGGAVRFRDESTGLGQMVDVVSDSGFVPAGTEVIVREVRGNHVVVRAMAV